MNKLSQQILLEEHPLNQTSNKKMKIKQGEKPL
jgi:hypothetical protein